VWETLTNEDATYRQRKSFQYVAGGQNGVQQAGSTPARSIETNAQDNPVRERKATMAEDTNEHLGSSDCSSGIVAKLRYLSAVFREDGEPNVVMAEAADHIEAMGKEIKQIHKDYGCEVRDPCGTIWEHAAKVEAERDKYKSAVERLRVLLLEVLENDEVLKGFNADNLEPEFRQRIRDGLSWKIE
jgi:hypothetical protein